MNHDHAIETRGLGRDFGQKRAVHELDLQVASGEIYGFLGRNGAGKTTTIRMLAGLLSPSRGSLSLFGRNYDDAGDELRRATGLVLDTPPLYEHLTGRQYAGFVAALYDIPAAQRDAELDRLLPLLDLEDDADRLCKGYSHGMQKKIHLAAVLVTRPRLLFLDEPTNGLDPPSARKLKDLLLSERARGTTVFLSTHLLETAEELCNRIGILHEGSLQCVGSPDELRDAYKAKSLEELFLTIAG